MGLPETSVTDAAVPGSPVVVLRTVIVSATPVAPVAPVAVSYTHLMQRAVLFAGTIRENIRWGKDDASDEEIMEALEIAQAADFVRQKEGNLSEYITQGATNLSGGQRQRLTIARALVRKPEICLLYTSRCV